MKHLKIFEEFKLDDIENIVVKKAIDIVKGYGIKVVFRDPDFFPSGSIANAAMKKNMIRLSTDLMSKGLDKAISIIFHELGHFYCYDTLKYKEYHYGFYKKDISEKEIKSMIRTAMKAELYVEKWAKKEMNTYFPELKFIAGYKRRDYIKRWIVNYLYDIHEDRIVELEAEKLIKILDEMGV